METSLFPKKLTKSKEKTEDPINDIDDIEIAQPP